MLGIKGNVRLGLAQLETAYRDQLGGDEARYYKFLLDAYLLGVDEKTTQNLLQFVENHPDYLSVYFLSCLAFTRNNHNEDAVKLLSKKPATPDYLLMPIFDYYQGELFLQRGNYQLASTYYLSFMHKNRNQVFLKETLLKLFYTHWLNNDLHKALSFYTRIGKTGSELVEADKNAQNFYTNHSPETVFNNKFLIKARLSFDGGFYRRAEQEINQIDMNSISSAQEKAEIYFRTGRIYQHLGNYLEAGKNYSQSIKLAEKQVWGFKTVSAFHLGEIQALSGNQAMAKSYFEKALSYSKLEKRFSTAVRAKLALEKL
ncbi:tetratricopeptide repeat protein [Spirosoma harenae]